MEYTKDLLRNFQTLEEFKELNKQEGYHFFDEDTMEFFNSKMETDLLNGNYFITSEQYSLSSPRQYSIRKANGDGTVDTIGQFQQYNSLKEAKEAVPE